MSSSTHRTPPNTVLSSTLTEVVCCCVPIGLHELMHQRAPAQAIADKHGLETIASLALSLSDYHQLTIDVEYCTAPRPSSLGTLTGSTERYAEAYEKFKTALEESVLAGTADITFNENR
jgi:hypothetical protein